MAWLGGQRQGKAAVSTPGLAESEEPAKPSAVTLYEDPPRGDITLEEFELCALARLQGMQSAVPD